MGGGEGAPAPQLLAPTLSRTPPALVPCTPPRALALRSFLISASSIQNDMMHFALNVVVLAVVMIPKLPAMEGQRLFGVNKGPGEEE